MKAMKRTILSTYEAGKKYGLSQSYLRHLIAKGSMKAQFVRVSKDRVIWLIEETSVKAFLKTPRKPGPKPKK